MRAKAWLAVFGAASVVIAACGSKTDLLIGRNLTSAGTGGAIPEAGLPDSMPTEGGTGGVSGAPEAAGAAGTPDLVCEPVEVPPLHSLVHRYSFDGTGTVISDSVGGAVWNGTLMGSDGSALDGAGVLQLGGVNGYVDLPNGILSSLLAKDVTLMAWTRWPKGGSAWQRIFDFGNTTRGEDPLWSVATGKAEPTYTGTTYLATSPYTTWPPGGNVGVELKTPSTPTIHLGAANSLKNSTLRQVTVVFEEGVGVRLYLDAQLLGSFASPLAKLSELQDLNDWLGRSQTDSDHAYNGAYAEFRIYAAALSPCAIASELAAGPDAAIVGATP